MPLTVQDFRELALSTAGAVESAHMNHPDFRLQGKIFASLGYPDERWGMVKLTPEQQGEFLTRHPDAFKPCRGAWGERGATNVYLRTTPKGALKAALHAAAQNVAAPKRRKGR
jgi:hypothetical protein